MGGIEAGMIQIAGLLPQLLQITPRVLTQEPMSKHTSFGVGGRLTFLLQSRIGMN